MVAVLEHYLAAFEAVAHPVLLLEAERIVASNQVALEVLGRDRAEVHGRPLTEFVEPAGEIAARLRAALDGSAARFDAWLRPPDGGALRRGQAAVRPLRPAAQPGLLVLSFHAGAATEPDAEPASRAPALPGGRLQALLESAPGVVIATDPAGDITYANRAPPGFRPADLVGRRFGVASAPDDARRLQQAVADAMRGEVTLVEVLGLGPRGPATEWYGSQIGPLRHDGEIVGAVVFTLNISERKRLEAQLSKSMEQVQAYAETLEEKSRRLEQEVEERRRVEEALRALSTPIIQVWRDVLALPVIGAVDRARAALMMERLLDEIVRTGSSLAILDLTGVERVDQETARYLLNIARAARLLGSRCVLSGVTPGIAASMVALGVEMDLFTNFGRLEDALRYALGRRR